jgi:hypothetical protein
MKIWFSFMIIIEILCARHISGWIGVIVGADNTVGVDHVAFKVIENGVVLVFVGESIKFAAFANIFQVCLVDFHLWNDTKEIILMFIVINCIQQGRINETIQTT